MAILDQIRPCDTNQPYVFISYSSLDRELVCQDVLEFQRRGYNIWLDDRNIDKTKASWKDDALAAIEDYCCALVVFYVSAWSLTSGACYDELRHTCVEDTIAVHNGEVKYIAVEVERIADIGDYKDEIHKNLMQGPADKKEKQTRAKILYSFVRDFFATNNEKVRVHPKNEPNRKMDYYDEVTASFPDETRIYTADPVPKKQTTDKKILTVVPEKEEKTDMTPEEMYKLGDKYYFGNGVSVDYAEAAKWYRKSAEQGNAVGQRRLGECYNFGNGVSVDYAEAVKWYRKSAEQGNAVGQYRLGECYYLGIGVPVDYTEAAKWYRKSAEQGNSVGQRWLGVCYHYGEGVPEDIAEAVKWYRRSAEQGYAKGQRDYGYCYYVGKGIPEDKAEAVKWYRKSAEQGDAEGQRRLGECYNFGNGIPVDYAEAVKWYRKSAEQGNAAGQYRLGECYYLGIGVPVDYTEAVKWYRKSAEQGNAAGQCWLGVCYSSGKGVPEDKAEAVKWYRKSADKGNAKAKKKLAELT